MNSRHDNSVYSGYYGSTPTGLVAMSPDGQETLVMSDREICDDIVATVTKLNTAVTRDTYGRRWKQGHRHHGVDLFELAKASGKEAIDEDRDIAHAVVAKTELRCHLNEVLNILITHESNTYECTMKALAGKKFKKGDVLFSQRRLLSSALRRQSVVAPRTEMREEAPEQALIGVNVTTLHPRMVMDLGGNKKTQKLCFSTFTQQYRGDDRAVHIMKTLPKELHDQLIPTSDRTALRNELDHLCVGFHIQSTHNDQNFAASNTHVTRIFAHGYASPTPPPQFGETTKKSDPTSSSVSSVSGILAWNSADPARCRENIMNPEAKHVLNVLTKSLCQFEQVVRRRRFGFQTYIYFPTGYDDPSLEKACSICSKRFHFFRRDFFCHLCGHMVCGDCSRLYEVEARIGEIRRNRCCLQCVYRVDSCVFDDEDLLGALGPAVVSADDLLWYNDDKYHLDALDGVDSDTASMPSDSSSVEELTEQLYSDDPSQNSRALDFLGQLVSPVAATYKYEFVSPKSRAQIKHRKSATKTQQVTQDVEKYLSQTLRASKDRYSSSNQCIVASIEEHDYVFNFDASKTNVEHHPLPPVPAPNKEARRLEAIEQMGVLQPGYDHIALDIIAQVAAKRLNCPTGFVSVVDNDSFRAIGTYNFPEKAFTLQRNNTVCIHAVYAEKALVLKNAMRDMRFAQMPVIKDLVIKFYAGFPVYGPDGDVVASLCVTDVVAHNNISTKDYATMEALAKLASDLVKPKTPGIY